jgi:hypothetical protein
MSSSPSVFCVRIEWLSPGAGGRRELPQVRVFPVNMRFEENGDLWSAVLLAPEDEPGTVADYSELCIAFPAPLFPEDRLVLTRRFEVAEATREIAVCWLIDEA